MADNVPLPPSAVSAATDELADGSHAQLIKIVFGASSVAVFWSFGAGVVDTGTPRLTWANDAPGIKAEDAAHASGDLGWPVWTVRVDVPTAFGAANDYAPFAVDALNRLWVSGTYAEDVAHVGGDYGHFVLAVRRDVATTGQGADGDYISFGIDAAGGLWTTETRLPALVAHDAADAGQPLKVGARARATPIAVVAENDRTDLVADLTGRLIIAPHTNPENIVSGATAAMTGTTSTSLIAAPAAGLRNYITTIIVSNAHATVGTDVIIQDGSGGTTLLVIPAAAVYGGAVITLPVPLRQPTTATAIFCANVVTGASTRVSAVGFKAP